MMMIVVIIIIIGGQRNALRFVAKIIIEEQKAIGVPYSSGCDGLIARQFVAHLEFAAASLCDASQKALIDRFDCGGLCNRRRRNVHL